MKHLLTAILSVGLTPFIWAQELEQSESSRYWLDGFSRTWFTSDALLEEQTSTGAISSGWNLLDLNPHVNPTPALEVFAQVRVLNEFGGFLVKGLKLMFVSCESRVLSRTRSNLTSVTSTSINLNSLAC